MLHASGRQGQMTINVERQLVRVEWLSARAALDPVALPELLAAVNRLTDGRMVTIETYEKKGGPLTAIVTDRPDIMIETGPRFAGHYCSVNPRLDLLIRAAPDTILTDDALGNDRALMALEFYADFLAPSDMRYFGASAIVDNADAFALASIQRAPSQGRFDVHDRRLLGAALPYLANATAMYLKLRAARPASLFGDLLDRMTDPIAIITPDARVLFANETMSGLIGGRDRFTLDRGRLEIASNPLQRAFGELMRAIRRGVKAVQIPIEPHLPGRQTLRAFALSEESQREFPGEQGPAYCLVLDGDGVTQPLVLENAMQLFGLTRREAEVGLHLANGQNISGIATAMDISRNTVRTHAAVLREKLGVSTSLAVAIRLRTGLGMFR
jgi:DNA-binding CsgD family transcriptional regulator